MTKYLTEFVGTLVLVLTIGLTVLQQVPMAPLAIGASLMIMVYMGGHISGGHYNPAVSVAAVLRGKLPTGELGPYIVAQLLGATVASLLVYLILGRTFAPVPAPTAGMLSAILIEILYTFALCLVVLNSACHEKTRGNSFYGLAIGFTIVVAAFAGGGISGGAFNPAVGIGPTLVNALMGGGSFGNLWLYVAGPLLGGGLAAGLFKMQDQG
jgi:aquaporin Z